MPDPDAGSPVEYPAAFAESDARTPEEGTGICLSGGGYRAMLFHLGSLWRLNELGILYDARRISSVSGGSITAATLGLAWSALDWRDAVAVDFVQRVVTPVRKLASRTIDVDAVLTGGLLPWSSAGRRISAAYRKHLFGDATLQDLPEEATGAPRFVINATSVQTGSLWRFSRKYMANWRVGSGDSPDVPLADAVAASSAFPPVLSPVVIRLPAGYLQPTPGADLHREPYTTRLILTDGGVYDNLGLETVWKRYRTVLVCDGGGQMAEDPGPASDWARHAFRVNELIDNQVRALRKRQVVRSLVDAERLGTYWRTRGRVADYPAAGTLPCPPERTLRLATIKTRLRALDDATQERLINWGYALADAAVRTWVLQHATPPVAFPYPERGV